MARIRSVKPEYATSAAIAELSIPCMMHFALLWTYADDEGRGLDDPRVIKGALWPLRDAVTAAQVDEWQTELASHGRIVRYEVDGKRLFQVTNFREHQKPNRPTDSKLPAPSVSTHAPADLAPPPAVSADSVSDHGALTPGGGEGVGGGDVDGDVDGRSKSQTEEPPAVDDAEAPQPEQDPEQAARKALNIYARTKAASEAHGDPSALAASIGRSAVDDGRLDLLREWIAGGLTPEAAALRLLDPFSLGGEGAPADSPRNVPAAESTHPLLRPVPTFCDDGSCEDGWVETAPNVFARCPKCNADPIGATA